MLALLNYDPLVVYPLSVCTPKNTLTKAKKKKNLTFTEHQQDLFLFSFSLVPMWNKHKQILDQYNKQSSIVCFLQALEAGLHWTVIIISGCRLTWEAGNRSQPLPHRVDIAALIGQHATDFCTVTQPGTGNHTIKMATSGWVPYMCKVGLF